MEMTPTLLETSFTGPYDDGYKACTFLWGKRPAMLVQQIVSNLTEFSKIRALDIGCGEGKNAFYMASNGIDVEAFDISELAISKARIAWPSLGNLKFNTYDVRNLLLPPVSFDIVVSTGLIHCLPDTHSINCVLSALMSTTRVGGYNILSTFNSRYQDLSGHDPDFHPLCLPHEFYMERYSNWEIIHHSDTDLDDFHGHIAKPHKHSITRICARKLY